MRQPKKTYKQKGHCIKMKKQKGLCMSSTMALIETSLQNSENFLFNDLTPCENKRNIGIPNKNKKD
jgi:hypothetical protein